MKQNISRPHHSNYLFSLQRAGWLVLVSFYILGHAGSIVAILPVAMSVMCLGMSVVVLHHLTLRSGGLYEPSRREYIHGSLLPSRVYAPCAV